MRNSFTQALCRFALAALMLLPGAATAQVREHEVKAAFLFKFPSFVEWSEKAFSTADSPLKIGVMAADEVLAELQNIASGRLMHGRSVIVRRVLEEEKVSDLHVLFVGRGASAVIPKLRQVPNLLVVSESDGALEQGSVINFVRSQGRVRFEVALDSAERHELRISSRMLAVARSVRPGKL